MRVSIAGFALLIAVFSGSGCATIVRGTEQAVIISCNVPQANVRLNGQEIDGRGFEYKLDRWKTYTVEADAPGYEPASVRIERSASVSGILCTFGNAIFGIFGIVGVIVDGSVGAWVELEPGDIYINLERSALKPSAKDTIVRVGEGGGLGARGGSGLGETGPPVLEPSPESLELAPRNPPASSVR